MSTISIFFIFSTVIFFILFLVFFIKYKGFYKKKPYLLKNIKLINDELNFLEKEKKKEFEKLEQLQNICSGYQRLNKKMHLVHDEHKISDLESPVTFLGGSHDMDTLNIVVKDAKGYVYTFQDTQNTFEMGKHFKGLFGVSTIDSQGGWKWVEKGTVIR